MEGAAKPEEAPRSTTVLARRYRAQVARELERKVALVPPPAEHGHGGEAVPIAAPDLQGAFEQQERLTLARRALDLLDAEKREAFVLACVEQRSAPEIAELVGLPLNTVYSRIRAARKAFAEAVDRLEPAPGRAR